MKEGILRAIKELCAPEGATVTPVAIQMQLDEYGMVLDLGQVYVLLDELEDEGKIKQRITRIQGRVRRVISI